MGKSVKRIELVMIGSFALQQLENSKWKAKGVRGQNGREFSLLNETSGRWRVSGINSSGSQIRKRFSAPGLTEAVEEASVILYQQTGSIQKHPELDLANAFHRALADVGGGKIHKQQVRRNAGYFMDWAEGRGIRFWHQVTYESVRRYMSELAERGLAKKTISHYLQAVRVTSRFLSATYPEFYHDVTRTLRIPHSLGRKERKWEELCGNPALSYPEVLGFLEWLEGYEHGAILLPGVMLQGLMGLQLMEALFLQWENVDFINGTVTVEDIDEHQLKNDERCRKLPMPRLVQNYLETLVSRPGRVLPYDGDFKAYGKLLKRAMLKWNPQCRITPKDLRNTLQDHAEKKEWSKFYSERFVGHAAQDIRGKHYVGSEAGKLTEEFRAEVADKIDQVINDYFENRPLDTLVARCSTFGPEKENPENGKIPRINEITELAG